MEDARPGQLVKREVTQILSPGTHFDERMLKAERNNFLAAVCPAGRTFGLAFVDLTTGDFMTTEVEGDAEALTELQRLRPAELIFPGGAAAGRGVLLGGRRRGGGGGVAVGRKWQWRRKEEISDSGPPPIRWGEGEPPAACGRQPRYYLSGYR